MAFVHQNAHALRSVIGSIAGSTVMHAIPLRLPIVKRVSKIIHILTL